jgi:hypothetical protein
MPAALRLICSNNVNRFLPAAAAADFTFLLALRMMAPFESSGDPVLARAGLLHTLLNGISCRFWPTGAFTNHITE